MRYASWVDKNLDVESKLGAEWLVFCPFHDNRSSAACCVNVVKGLYICYSCGAKGTVEALARKVNAPLTEVFSVEGVRETRDGLRQTISPIVKHPDSWLKQFSGHKEAAAYWRTRGFGPTTMAAWDLGFDRSAKAATIPLRDYSGNVLGVIKRRMGKDAHPRYLYPKGFKISLHLFGAHKARKAPKDVLAITEGSVDCISVWQFGVPAVALLGVQLSASQLGLIRKINPQKIVLFLDNDQPGIEATAKVGAQIMADGFDVLVADYPISSKAKDPAGLTPPQRTAAIKCAQSIRALRLSAMRRTV